MFRKALFVCLLGLMVSLTGCIKFTQHFHILPDGSGKVVQSYAMMPFEQMKPFLLKMGLPEEMLTPDMMEQNDEDPLEKFKDLEGVVWEEPVESVGEDGWTYTTVTGYYKDINEVGGSEGAVDGLSFEAFEDGHRLSLEGDKEEGDEEPKGEEQPQDPAMEAVMKEMMANMEFLIEFHMPGAIKSVDPELVINEHVLFGKRSENSAGIHMDGALLSEMEGNEPPEFENDSVVTSGAPDEAALADLQTEVSEALKRHATR